MVGIPNCMHFFGEKWSENTHFLLAEARQAHFPHFATPVYPVYSRGGKNTLGEKARSLRERGSTLGGFAGLRGWGVPLWRSHPPDSLSRFGRNVGNLNWEGVAEWYGLERSLLVADLKCRTGLDFKSWGPHPSRGRCLPMFFPPPLTRSPNQVLNSVS